MQDSFVVFVIITLVLFICRLELSGAAFSTLEMNGITGISGLGREIHSLPPNLTLYLPHNVDFLGVQFSFISIERKLTCLLRPSLSSTSQWAFSLLPSVQSPLILWSPQSLTHRVLNLFLPRLVTCLYVCICISFRRIDKTSSEPGLGLMVFCVCSSAS